MVDRAAGLGFGLLFGLALLLGVLTIGPAACKSGGKPRISPAEAVLERQRRGLEALIAAAQGGPLIPFQQVLVVVDQKLVQDLLSAATPYERIIANRFRVRLTSASVRFEDGFALVRLDGRASLASREEREVFADLSLYGGLDVVDLDPASGVLRGRVNIIAYEAKRVGVLGMEAPVRRLIEDLGQERVEEFNVLASSLEIPIRLEREITIPEVGPEGEIRIPPATVPLKVEVQDVKAYRGKLWVTVGVDVPSAGPEAPAEEQAAPANEQRRPADEQVAPPEDAGRQG